jgi:environmental stress-induced protein Ves
MHNNGTNRIILPSNGPVLSSVAPVQAGVRIAANAAGVAICPFAGDQSLPMQLTAEQATALGVNLISAAALQQHAVRAAQEATKANTADPFAHEKTPPPIVIAD